GDRATGGTGKVQVGLVCVGSPRRPPGVAALLSPSPCPPVVREERAHHPAVLAAEADDGSVGADDGACCRCLLGQLDAEPLWEQRLRVRVDEAAAQTGGLQVRLAAQRL